MNSDIFVGIFGIIVLAAIIGYLYIKKKNDKEKGNLEVEKFLKSLEGIFQTFILQYVDAIDITNIVNVNEAQKEVLEGMYDDLWNLVQEELESSITDEFNKALIKKFLTKENVEEMARNIFNNDLVQEKFTKRYNDQVVAANNRAGEYEKGAVEFTNQILSQEDTGELKMDTKYDIGDEHDLNPQRDEEEVIDPSDESVEILEE